MMFREFFHNLVVAREMELRGASLKVSEKHSAK